MNPFFSIVVPIYNGEKYISRLLDSILAQNYSSFEVILVDDGSLDRSRVICNEYALLDERLKVVHKQNGGVSSARNKGINEAKGKWILFFDSDDVVHYDILECVHKAIIDNAGSDVVIYAIDEVMLDGRKIDHLLPIKAPFYYDANMLRTEILPYFCNSSSFLNSPFSKAFKRDIIEEYEIRFKKRVRGEDWLFCLEYFYHVKSAITIPNVLYSYMRNEGSAMSKYCPEQFQLWTENWQCKLKLIKDFQLKVDMNAMRREMYVKTFYFIKKIKEIESQEIRNEHLENILCSDLLQEWLTASSSNFHNLYIKYHLIFTRLFICKK